jgi:hypothetical protein
MEAICSIETAVDFQRTTQHYIPQDRTITATAARTSNPIFSRSVHCPKMDMTCIFFCDGSIRIKQPITMIQCKTDQLRPIKGPTRICDLCFIIEWTWRVCCTWLLSRSHWLQTFTAIELTAILLVVEFANWQRPSYNRLRHYYQFHLTWQPSASRTLQSLACLHSMVRGAELG